MRTIRKVVKIATPEAQPLNQILCRLLRSYRTTPHSTNSIAPATAIFIRPIRVRLPEMTHFRGQKDDTNRNTDIVQEERISNNENDM